MTSFLTILQEQWASLDAGRWHLALAVASPFPRAASLQALATTAVAAGSARVFRDRVAEPGRLNKSAHHVLRDLKALVTGAVNAGAPDSGLAPDALTWRLLAHLSILDLRLEGVRPEDRTAAVERLQPVAAQGAAADGSALFSRLRECASDYAPTGATVTRESLLRALSGWPLTQNSAPPTPPDKPRPLRKRAASRSLPQLLWSRPDRLRPGARQPRLHGDTLLVVDGHVLHAFDAKSGEPLWRPRPMGHNNQPPVDGTTVFTSGMGNTLRPRDIRSGAETGPRLDRCAAAQAVCDRGTLYVPDRKGTLHAYDTTLGRRLWSWRPEPTASGFLEPPRIVDDTVYVTWISPSSSQPWAVQALHADTGDTRWPEPLRLPSPQRWLISGDKVLAIIPDPDTGAPCLATYDVCGGTLLWQKHLSDWVVGKPTTSEKSFHLAHPDGHVSSWDALTGDTHWKAKVAKSLRTHPVAAGTQVLITSWDPGRLVALDSTDGTVTWRGTVRPTAALMTPAYLAGDSAWAVTRAGVLQGWDLRTRRRLAGAHEDLLWKPDVQGMPELRDGVLYVVTGNGNLHAICLDGPEQSVSAPSFRGLTSN
ncbi:MULTISPECIES: PQQ-binding-like beta-propeller repeat protein [unclassified Streptomyces]|uniref:outer membrane protein assembly factor BamB family protein n=1 Tax=unclassified Streptomyces TaxID=2593676 RepID=UPI0037F524B2